MSLLFLQSINCVTKRLTVLVVKLLWRQMLVHWKALTILYTFPTNLLTTILVCFVQAVVFDTWVKSPLGTCAVRLANASPRGGGGTSVL